MGWLQKLAYRAVADSLLEAGRTPLVEELDRIVKEVFGDQFKAANDKLITEN